jgi:hypothetical protein
MAIFLVPVTVLLAFKQHQDNATGADGGVEATTGPVLEEAVRNGMGLTIIVMTGRG